MTLWARGGGRARSAALRGDDARERLSRRGRGREPLTHRRSSPSLRPRGRALSPARMSRRDRSSRAPGQHRRPACRLATSGGGAGSSEDADRRARPAQRGSRLRARHASITFVVPVGPPARRAARRDAVGGRRGSAGAAALHRRLEGRGGGRVESLARRPNGTAWDSWTRPRRWPSRRRPSSTRCRASSTRAARPRSAAARRPSTTSTAARSTPTRPGDARRAARCAAAVRRRRPAGDPPAAPPQPTPRGPLRPSRPRSPAPGTRRSAAGRDAARGALARPHQRRSARGLTLRMTSGHAPLRRPAHGHGHAVPRATAPSTRRRAVAPRPPPARPRLATGSWWPAPRARRRR